MTELIFAFAAIITTAYILLQLQLMIWWRKKTKPEISGKPSRKLLVIVPARNESSNIEACIRSLSAQDYPRELVRFLIVNDHSDDDTFQRASQLCAGDERFEVLSLPESMKGKKQAIAYAAKHASEKNEDVLVVTTDADCTHAPQWLSCLAAADEKYSPVFISAPVMLESKPGFLQAYQQQEWCGLQLAGGAALQGGRALLCSGANLAYPMSLLREARFFSDDQLASGDDMRMLEMAAQSGKLLVFLADHRALVTTQAADSWKVLLQQRIRWTSKMKEYRSFFIVKSGLVVFLINFWILISLVLWLAGILSWNVFAVPWLAKAVIDILFLTLATAFFRQRNALLYYIPAQLLYFGIAVLATLGGLAGAFEWKKRRYKRGAA